MNAEELKSALQPFFDNFDEIGVNVYALLKGEETSEPKRLDIESSALSGLKELFVQSLQRNVSDKEDLEVLELSASDERTNAIYVYDLEMPNELAPMSAILETDELPLLSLSSSAISNIKALLIEIGNDVGQVVLYKAIASINIFGRSSFFLIKHEHRLEEIKEEFLRVDPGFQFFRINGELLILNLEALEKSFGFHDVIKREAALGVASIEGIDLVDNPEVLHELLDDVKYARKLTKVAKSSPVLRSGVPNSSIINFCKTFPGLAGKIRFNDEENKIVLHSKVSKDLFIKLLMDNFLTSQLTNFHYTSVAKDSIDEDAVA